MSVSVTAFGLVLARRPISMSKLSDSAALCDICAVALVRSEDQEEIVVYARGRVPDCVCDCLQPSEQGRSLCDRNWRSVSQPANFYLGTGNSRNHSALISKR